MNLPDVKKLKQIIALCRKTGVESIEIDGVKITLGAEPSKAPRKTKKAAPVDDGNDEIESDELTDESLLFWSTGALAEEKNQ